jgi:glucose-6-phosphate-specific signal transduction histidine kinase
VPGYALVFSAREGRLPRLLRVPTSETTTFRYELERRLHDEVAVGMSAIAAQLDLVAVASADPDLDDKIGSVRATLCRVVEHVRDVGKSVFPPVLGGTDFSAALTAIADHRDVKLQLDLPSYELHAQARARVGLLVCDHLNTLSPGTVVRVRVRGRRLVRVRITENPDHVEHKGRARVARP